MSAKILMMQSGVSRRDLAAMTGYSLEAVNKAFYYPHRLTGATAAIEAVLGKAIWSKAHDLAFRNNFKAHTGIDPMLANVHQLYALARQLGIPGTSHLHRKPLIDRIVNHLSGSQKRHAGKRKPRQDTAARERPVDKQPTQPTKE